MNAPPFATFIPKSVNFRYQKLNSFQSVISEGEHPFHAQPPQLSAAFFGYFLMQTFLFSLLNTLADASHSIDLISTQINKYHLHADFQCADKPTSNGFHGHLIIEQIEIADGYGINKKLAKKQVIHFIDLSKKSYYFIRINISFTDQ